MLCVRITNQCVDYSLVCGWEWGLHYKRGFVSAGASICVLRCTFSHVSKYQLTHTHTHTHTCTHTRTHSPSCLQSWSLTALQGKIMHRVQSKLKVSDKYFFPTLERKMPNWQNKDESINSKAITHHYVCVFLCMRVCVCVCVCLCVCVRASVWKREQNRENTWSGCTFSLAFKAWLRISKWSVFWGRETGGREERERGGKERVCGSLLFPVHWHTDTLTLPTQQQYYSCYQLTYLS